ncbi:MAG: SpoIIE family protein phosphatase [bacterium]|nr:SpoIIE family protein phosphatase [bacterium]
MGKSENEKKDAAVEESKDAPAKKKKEKSGIRFGLRIKFSLAIIGLVSLIIIVISVYFILRESRILQEQVFQFTESEITHFANTARESIFDDIALYNAINNLEKRESFRYAFFLGDDNKIIRHFDKRDTEYETEQDFKDSVERKLEDIKDNKEIKRIETPDLLDKKGIIYDFSKGVFNKANVRMGSVIIGLSDVVIRKKISEAIWTISFLSVMMLGISMVGAIILASITVNPIKKLSHGATVIGKGNLDYHIDIKRSDELGKLAREFNTMTAMIKEAKDKEIESRVMEEQLEVARDIQEGLNPMGFYDKGGIQIKGFTKAAKGVGGDYFDYIDIDEHRVGALISDVSGKGVPASLVMVMIKTVFTSFISRKDVDCASVVRAINDSLSAGMAIDKFATLFFMIYDRRTEELAFSNAGHGPLKCYRASTKKCTATKLEGVPIGIMDDVEYTQAKVKLYPGDFVVLETDGVTEMRNSEKDEYGLKRVLDKMVDHPDLNAEEFVDLVVDDVDDFRGETSPHDDETLLVFKRVS